MVAILSVLPQTQPYPGFSPYAYDPYYPTLIASPSSQSVVRGASPSVVTFEVKYEVADQDQWRRDAAPNDIEEKPISYTSNQHEILFSQPPGTPNEAWDGTLGKKTWTYSLTHDTTLMTSSPGFVWTRVFKFRAKDTTPYLEVKDPQPNWAVCYVYLKYYPDPEPSE